MALAGSDPRQSHNQHSTMFHHEISNEEVCRILMGVQERLESLKDPEEEMNDAEKALCSLIEKFSQPAELYVIWGPDDLPIHHEPLATVGEVARMSAMFITRYLDQGYYRDARGQALPLGDLPMKMRVEPHPALMTPHMAYCKYVQENVDRMDEGWRPVCFEEFVESEECQNYMDPYVEEEVGA